MSELRHRRLQVRLSRGSGVNQRWYIELKCRKYDKVEELGGFGVCARAGALWPQKEAERGHPERVAI